VDTRRLEKGVNTPLTSRVSGIRGIRARELDATTREVASCEKCEGRSTLADFQVSEVRTGGARRLNPSTCEVTKLRWELALSLAGGHAWRALTREGAIPVSTFWVS
jgi:hypothetical protein